MKRFYWFLIFGLLVSSCQTAQKALVSDPTRTQDVMDSTGGVPEKTVEVTISPTIPTSISATPTQSPTPTEMMPALNRTAIPAPGDQIMLSNIGEVRVLKQTSSTAPVEILGAEGSRWFVQIGDSAEVHGSKTNEIIWKPAGSQYITIDSTGTKAFLYTNDFSKIEIQNEKGWKDTFNIPPIDLASVYLTQNISNKLLAVEQGSKIDIYSLGKNEPKYSLDGFFAVFTTGEKYITYLQGKILVFVNAESGKKVAEFGLGQNDYNEITVNQKNIWKTSWDDQYLALSRNGTLEIWRIVDRKLVRSIPIKDNYFLESNQFVFSKANKSLMVLHPDGMIKTWMIESGEIIQNEKTELTSLNHLRVTDAGEILKFNLPQIEIPGRSWKTTFSDQTIMNFLPNTNSLAFTNQSSTGYFGSTEICGWDLINQPACDFHQDQIWANPANYRLLRLGNDGEKFYLKSGAEPVTLHHGWDADGKFITQLPKISSQGYIFDFQYDPFTGILISRYSDGKSLIVNHKTNSRLLADGTDRRFFLSKDGAFLLELVNKKNSPEILEFVKYDSKTLKEISRNPLEITIHPLAKDKTIEDLIPILSTTALSPDGKNLYAYLNYSSELKKDKIQNSAFLTIPIDSPEKSILMDLGVKSAAVSNMLISNQGDLAIIAEIDTGVLHFIDPSSGKINGNLDVGGRPILLTMRPDGKILSVADIENGIKLIGIPAN